MLRNIFPELQINFLRKSSLPTVIGWNRQTVISDFFRIKYLSRISGSEHCRTENVIFNDKPPIYMYNHFKRDTSKTGLCDLIVSSVNWKLCDMCIRIASVQPFKYSCQHKIATKIKDYIVATKSLATLHQINQNSNHFLVHYPRLTPQLFCIFMSCSSVTDCNQTSQKRHGVSKNGRSETSQQRLGVSKKGRCERSTRKRSYIRTANVTNQPLLQRTVVSGTNTRRLSVEQRRTYMQGVNVLNPIKELQPYLSIPIVPDNKLMFDPTQEEVMEALRLFVPRTGHQIEHLKSVVNLEKLPEYKKPEIAFLGRSNVGKSSLIKALFQDISDLDIKTSKKPGHTKTLTFFQVGKAFSLVDMPGYGHHMPKYFVESVETYLKTRKKLSRSFVLVDAETGLTSTDLIGLTMMEEFKIPYVIVMTKIDKASRAVVLKNLMSVLQYRDDAHCCFSQPFLVSSITGSGIALLKTFIAYVTGNVRIEGM